MKTLDPMVVQKKKKTENNLKRFSPMEMLLIFVVYLSKLTHSIYKNINHKEHSSQLYAKKGKNTFPYLEPFIF